MEDSYDENDFTPREKPPTKMLSLGFSRAAVDDPLLHRAQAQNPNTSKGASNKEDRLRGIILNDIKQREIQSLDFKRNEDIHPFDLTPKKHLLKKNQNSNNRNDKVYDGLKIGIQKSPEMMRQEKKKSAEAYQNILNEDLALTNKLRNDRDLDSGIDSSRRPFPRKTSDSYDIDPNCPILNIGYQNDNYSIKNKKQLYREIMMDNIAASNGRSDTKRQVEPNYEGFFIGSDPLVNKIQDRTSKKEYKDLLDRDVSPRRGKDRFIESSKDSVDGYINHSGLTGLNIGNRDESISDAKYRKNLYKEMLDQQAEYSRFLKMKEIESDKNHFSGKMPYLQS